MDRNQATRRRWTEVRGTARALLALGLLFCLVVPALAGTARRAAIADDRLAAEIEGVLFMEVMASGGDTAVALAENYAGDRKAAGLLRAANGGREPAPGKFYRLPFEVLLNDHRRLVLAALYPQELPSPPLEFQEDRKGAFAVYRLAKGEALYSSVVVRFTGRVDPKEVNDLAQQIAGRSGISNVRNIPAGHRIRIPVEYLLPEFHPPGSDQRLSAEAEVTAAARHRLTAGAARLAGVHIILDAGHGGRDSGAIRKGVYEDEHAYDVMVRLRNLLLKRSAANVVTTIQDRSSKYRPLEGRIHPDKDEFLLTDPHYDLRSNGATKKGVNKRFKLANGELDKLKAQGVKPEKVVFISLHADVLHPSVRGAMVYVPGLKHRPRGRIPTGMSRADVQEQAGLSRNLAREVLGALKSHGVPIHRAPAIRDHVIRSGRRWIPAVIRVSHVPHSLLVEVANINNTKDRKLLVRSSFRQKVAEAIVDALMAYYGGEGASPAVAERRGADSAS